MLLCLSRLKKSSLSTCCSKYCMFVIFYKIQICSSLYLFIFFSLLRISNILPHSIKQFDVTRHLLREDLTFSDQYCTVIVKWSKTLQDRQQSRTISISQLGASPLFSIQALQIMFQQFPASKNQPLFYQWKHGNLVPLTDSVARNQEST